MTNLPIELAEEHAKINGKYDPLNAICRYMRNSFLVGYKAATPQWISVNDRLPEEELIEVLVLISGDGWHDYDIAYFALGKWHDKYDDHVEGVTHWQPLPEPPKEEG